MTSVLFLVQFEISTRLWASFGVTHSYSSCLFLCALALVYLLFPSLIPSSHHTRYSHVGSEVSGKPTQGHQFSSTKCNNYSIILGHMHSVYIAQMLWQMRLLRFILHVCWEVWLARIYVSLLCRRETFKIRWTCNTEGSIFQNLTRKHTPGTLLQGKAPCKPIIYFLDTHVCPLLVTTALCEEEET